jgi:hypothetical protein
LGRRPANQALKSSAIDYIITTWTAERNLAQLGGNLQRLGTE